MSGQRSGEGGGVLGGVRQQWDDTDPKVRGLLMVLVGCFAAFLVWRAFTAPAPAPTTRQRTAADAGQPAVNGAEARDGFHAPVLPETPRNQGLEDLKQAVETLNGRLARLEGGRGDASAMGATAGASRPAAPPVPAPAPSLTQGASGAGANAPQATQPTLPITPGTARKPGASGATAWRRRA